MNCNKEAKSLTFRRGSEVSQVSISGIVQEDIVAQADPIAKVLLTVPSASNELRRKDDSGRYDMVRRRQES